MKKANIQYTWNTIYIALKYDFIEIEELKIYVIELLELEFDKYKDNIFINDLIFENLEKDIILQRIENENFIDNFEIFKELELNKIKYVFLFYLEKEIKISKDLVIKKIAELYIDFHYPEDMCKLIYYMPNLSFKKDNFIDSFEDNFYNYLYKIKKLIS